MKAEATQATDANASELDRLARQSPDLQPQELLKDIAESRRRDQVLRVVHSIHMFKVFYDIKYTFI